MPDIAQSKLIRDMARDTAHAVVKTCRYPKYKGCLYGHSAACDNATDVIENNMIALVAMVQQDHTVDQGDCLSVAKLKELMRKPEYWRDNDPALVKQVRDGFRRLYAEGG